MNNILKIVFNEDYIIETTLDYSPMRKNTFTKVTTDKLDEKELEEVISKKTRKLNLSYGRRATLTEKEMYHKVTHEYKKLFKKDDIFETKLGINIIVGDNGCGKSTLMRELIQHNIDYIREHKLQVYHIDMEKANPKISKPNPERGIAYNLQEIQNIFMWNVESHGETREGVLMSILQQPFDILLLDEPEQGLSLRNQLRCLNKLKETNKPVIVNTHSKVLIENVEEVFDVETMKWINSKEYLSNILQ